MPYGPPRAETTTHHSTDRTRIGHSVYSLPIGKKDSPKTHTVTYLKPNQMLSIPKFSMVRSRVSTWALL